MGTTFEEPEQNETKCLMIDDNVPDNESTKLDELSFPWPIIHAVQDAYKRFQSIPRVHIGWLFSFHFHMLVMFIFCIVCIVFGSLDPIGCGYHMGSTIFVIQGICGLIVISMHITAIAISSIPRKTTRLPIINRQIIRLLIAIAHLATIFWILWFFIGHIWFVVDFIKLGGCWKTRLFTTIMMIFQYVMGIWITYCSMRDRPWALRWVTKKNQHCPKQIASDEKCLDGEKTVERKRTVGNNVNVDVHLITI